MTLKQQGKKLANDMMSDTPRWVKLVQLAGLGLGAVGGALATGPDNLPDLLVDLGPWLSMLGNATALFVQKINKL